MTGTGEWLRQYLHITNEQSRVNGRKRAQQGYALGYATDQAGPAEGSAPLLYDALLPAGADDDRVWAVERDEPIDRVRHLPADKLDDDA
jgi:hypothetical protein